MNRHRFSDQLLKNLRNRIPIHTLIPSAAGGPKRRFSCPLCGGHDTAVNPAANLARCFACQKNFNPIDWVMASQNLGFADAVDWLKPLLEHGTRHLEHHPVSDGPATPPRACKRQPEALDRIIPSVLESIAAPNPGCSESPKRLEARLADVERKLARLEAALLALQPPLVR